nr:hypothetical protein [Lactobacillus johnsonii]
MAILDPFKVASGQGYRVCARCFDRDRRYIVSNRRAIVGLFSIAIQCNRWRGFSDRNGTIASLAKVIAVVGGFEGCDVSFPLLAQFNLVSADIGVSARRLVNELQVASFKLVSEAVAQRYRELAWIDCRGLPSVNNDFGAIRIVGQRY